MLGCIVVLIAALAFGFFLHIKQLIANSPKPGPQTVTTAVASPLEWQPQPYLGGDTDSGAWGRYQQ